MHTEPNADPDGKLVDLFAAYLAKRSTGDVDLEEFCRQHPDQAGDLEKMRSVFALVEGAFSTHVPAAPSGRQVFDVGTCFGPYEILAELGHGAQGTVYRARDVRLGRDVALKVLPSANDAIGHRLERFMREAELASRLDHPGICSVYDTGRHEGHAYFAMRYIRGRTLADVIDRARRDAAVREGAEWVPTVIRWIEAVARALHVAHEAGLVHRDIKPGNLMIDEEGRPVVLDFGLAHELDSDSAVTMPGDLLGTPAYMSPEQLTAQRVAVDRRTDVYSLGATLYECLTTCCPFDAPTLPQLFQKILSERATPVRRFDGRISKDLAAVVETALEKDRTRRYKTALDFAEDLRRVLAVEPILAKPPGPVGRIVRYLKRKPLVALAGAIAAAALVFVGLFVQSRLSHERSLRIARFPFLLRQAKSELDALYPSWPGIEQELAGWRSRFVPRLQRGLREVRRRVDEVFARSVGGRFEDPADRAVYESAREQIADYERFAEDDRLGIASIPKRIEWSRSIDRRSLEEYADEWARVVAEVRTKPPYGGLSIEPRRGLVPLRRNPRTDLFEFVHLASGTHGREIPQAGTDGKLRVTKDTGIVFVLLPAGDLSRADAGKPDLAIGAFFVAKHEMTQAQWMRLGDGSNPSTYRPGRSFANQPVTAVHPVDTASWNDCAALLRRHALWLPTRQQAEYACRAGTRTTWPTGDRLESLVGFANVGDRIWGKYTSGVTWLEIDDGFYVHAPVGSFVANAFGLFDVIGNVGEFCAGATQRNGFRFVRPASFQTGVAAMTTSRHVGWIAPDERDDGNGVRPVISLGNTTENGR